MSGFDNDVLYADNVDFTGSFPIAGQINLDGELLVGSSVSPFIRSYVPTGSTGVSIATGQGTLDFSLANVPNSALQNSSITVTAGTGITVSGSPVSLGGAVTLSVTGGAAVTSVSGTANRITSTGGTTPVIDISASFVGQSSITTVGTIGSGTWQGTVLGSTYGGTGINNGASTITLGGSLTTSGAFASTFTMTNTTSVTFPTSGTLATTSQLTNGTVTSVSGTANQVAVATGTTTPVISLIGPYTPATYTTHGVLIGEATSSIAATSAGSSGQHLQSQGASADPTWTTATFPATATTTGQILRADGTNWVGTTATYPNTAGTSGNVLSSDGTNWASVATSTLSGVLQVTSGTLTSAQIKALHGTPIQAVAAPGSGKIIIPVSWIGKFNYGGTNVFVAGAAQQIQFFYGTTVATGQVILNAQITATTTRATTNIGSGVDDTLYTTFENTALNLYNSVATEITGNAANNNTVTWVLYYLVFTI